MYSIDVSGFSLVEQKGNDTGVGNLFFLLDGDEVIDGLAGVA